MPGTRETERMEPRRAACAGCHWLQNTWVPSPVAALGAPSLWGKREGELGGSAVCAPHSLPASPCLEGRGDPALKDPHAWAGAPFWGMGVRSAAGCVDEHQVASLQCWCSAASCSCLVLLWGGVGGRHGALSAMCRSSEEWLPGVAGLLCISWEPGHVASGTFPHWDMLEASLTAHCNHLQWCCAGGCTAAPGGYVALEVAATGSWWFWRVLYQWRQGKWCSVRSRTCYHPPL